MAALSSPARNLIEPSAPAAGSAASLANRIMLRLVKASLPVLGPAGALRGGGGGGVRRRWRGAGLALRRVTGRTLRRRIAEDIAVIGAAEDVGRSGLGRRGRH